MAGYFFGVAAFAVLAFVVIGLGMWVVFRHDFPSWRGLKSPA
jgi:hypothetical protein